MRLSAGPRSRPARAGFTLIELLVVISIIAVLAGMLFPVLAKARAKAYEVTCSSYLRQIAMGMQMYVDDWDEEYSPGIVSITAAGHFCAGVIWADNIYTYSKNDEMFICPRHQVRGFSYGMNRSFERLSLSAICSPAQKISFVDYYGIHLPGSFEINWYVTPPQGISPPIYRHENAAMAAFADGHVKRMREGQINDITVWWNPWTPATE